MNKILAYLKLPEMRSFLYFLPMTLAFFVLTGVETAFHFFAGTVFLFNLFFFVALGFLLYKNNLAMLAANKSLRKERAELGSVIATLQDAIVAYDPNFKVMVFNGVAEALFNLRADEVVGKIFTPDKIQEPRLKIFIQTMFPSLAPAIIRRSEPGAYPQLIDISFGDGKLELRTATNKVFDSKGNLLGFVKIVSNRTREAELLRSKSEFIGVAAHQLRSPLTGLHWMFEVLDKENLSDNGRMAVGVGAERSAFALKIVNDLLDVAQIEEGRFDYNFKRADLVFVLGEIVGAAQKTIEGTTLQINFQKPAEPIEILMDAEKVSMALISILNNAIVYNVKNGEVFVGVEKSTDKSYAQITIKDTGIGIPPADLKKIFTKFFRSENAIRYVPNGSGLALFIANNIIRRHGGEIKIESELSRGSVFIITLPTDPNLIPSRVFGYFEE